MPELSDMTFLYALWLGVFFGFGVAAGMASHTAFVEFLRGFRRGFKRAMEG